MSVNELLRELKRQSTPERAKSSARFFKSEPGQYGYGDQFLGVTVPVQRAISKQFRSMTLQDLTASLQSPWHEVRLTTLFILVYQYGKAPTDEKEKLVQFYLDHSDRVNNWDLVDSTAYQILGDYLLHRPAKRKILYKLAKSKNLWEQRISVVANKILIKNDEFKEFLAIAEQLLAHPHDLIHKATGWMLRELGERNMESLCVFLDENAKLMPRTMLRYAIEKFPKALRDSYLS